MSAPVTKRQHHDKGPHASEPTAGK
jgi:hypothetical protein